jgi:hypothetical protein
MGHGITEHKRNLDASKVHAASQNAQSLRVAKDALKVLENNNEIEKKAIKRKNEQQVNLKKI